MQSAQAELDAHWSGKSVLVTGATGSIGLNLLARLHMLNANVHVFMREPVDTKRLWTATPETVVHGGDITDRDALANAFTAGDPDVVFHLATPRSKDVDNSLDLVAINVLAAINLVQELALRPSAKLVVAGSSFEYAAGTSAHRETDTLKPTTWFGVSKATAGSIFDRANDIFGCQIIQLRLFHVYGCWEKQNRLLPSAILTALEGRTLALTNPGIHRDWIYVEDVVDAVLKAGGTHGRSDVYNIGSGIEHSNEEVADAVEAVTRLPIKRNLGAFKPRATDTPHRCADISKAIQELDWRPRRNLTEGIAATLDWYHANKQFWNR